MDFYEIRTKKVKDKLQVYPAWFVDNTVEDLMVRGGDFYAVWDERKGMWSTDPYDVQRFVDADIRKYMETVDWDPTYIPMWTRDAHTSTWKSFINYIRDLPNEGLWVPLDDELTFANDKPDKKHYASKRLPYSLEEGTTDAWDELVSVLYEPSEVDKIEWSIGAIVSGASKRLQKFLVFYGSPGSGKSTIINIFEQLFEGYSVTFDAKALTSNGHSFATEPFQGNPLVAVQHDGDLSRVEDNTRLNSIVSHDRMVINAKFKSMFEIRSNAFLVVGTNQPVKITDAKAGTMRRLLDVMPSGNKISSDRYFTLIEHVKYELGAIAFKCLKRFKELGEFYYADYEPTEMMMRTNAFSNFIEYNFDVFKNDTFVQLKQAWEMYKVYCEEMNIRKPLQHQEFRTELENYFHEFKDRHVVDNKEFRSTFFGFKGLPGQRIARIVEEAPYEIVLESIQSIFDTQYPDQPAQYARHDGYPIKKWAEVRTTLADVDTDQLHWVKVPEQHIVLDFDLVDEDGEKDLGLNLAAAAKFPPTYTELSRSGKGVHLHYIYAGNVHDLDNVYDVGVEIKKLLGDQSLRRKLTKCNNLPIAKLTGGLPIKEVKPVIETKSMKTEKSLRDLIERNLRKEIHPGTKPSIDFIHHILEEAYEEGLAYNVEDMKPRILAFAAKSSNQAITAIRLVRSMKFVGKDMEQVEEDDSPIVFFDVEVYPNLFVVCWKKQDDPTVVRLINPSSDEIDQLIRMKLVGFNNRRYDNHILYGAYLGYDNQQIFELSQKLINDQGNKAMFGEAYNLSYADIYDFSSKKQGLKKFQLELGIFHVELDIPWDEPVDESLWSKVEEYCVNDVISTEAVFNARKQDFVAREILSHLSGLSVNHTTQQHTARIVFGDDRKPQSSFVYTDLARDFPGYRFDGAVSSYQDESPGEGGYVYAEPGFYENVTVLDVASMHPTTIRELNLFGPYTRRYDELLQARLAIKRKEFGRARELLDGRLRKFVDGDMGDVEDLAYALKIVINIVYGLTSARFDNPFRDWRNKDNIVAKRGALFMIDLKHAVQDEGFQVVHIKTDSIKIPNATPEIIKFVEDFGRRFGYDFELEAVYEKFCLVNDAVYVARSGGKWTAVGAQFQHPYVFKELFSHDPVEFDDLCEAKNVQKGRIYLDLSGSGDPAGMRHVGRTGSFMPVKYDGGDLWRIHEDRKHAVTGTKGFKWIERDVAWDRQAVNDLHTDMDYFEELKREALQTIEKFVPYENLVN